MTDIGEHNFSQNYIGNYTLLDWLYYFSETDCSFLNQRLLPWPVFVQLCLTDSFPAEKCVQLLQAVSLRLSLMVYCNTVMSHLHIFYQLVKL